MAVIKDVAKLAAVSTGTVSKYLNNPDSLKDDTRKRVEAAINTLQYKPSPLARSMRTGKTNTLAVVVPDISNPFYAEVYNAIRVSALQKGYTSILYTTEDNPDTLRAYLTESSIYRADGLILCFLDEDETLGQLLEAMEESTPIVLLGWDISNTRFNSVAADVFEGIYDATRHLVEKGYQRIAYIGGPEKDKISKEKLNGFTRAIKDAGHEIQVELVHNDSYSLQSGYHSARKLAMLLSMPGAIVAENDILAIGCIKYFLQRKIRIPEDIAVIGFDNIPLSAMYEPSLSTISLPYGQMGSEAVKMILSRLEKPSLKNKQVILKTSLVVRTSTDKNAPVAFE